MDSRFRPVRDDIDGYSVACWLKPGIDFDIDLEVMLLVQITYRVSRIATAQQIAAFTQQRTRQWPIHCPLGKEVKRSAAIRPMHISSCNQGWGLVALYGFAAGSARLPEHQYGSSASETQ
jgi:hypothetical protein